MHALLIYQQSSEIIERHKAPFYYDSYYVCNCEQWLYAKQHSVPPEQFGDESVPETAQFFGMMDSPQCP